MASIKVSDHALVRFIERMGGLDVEGVRLALSTSLNRAAEAAAQLEQSEYTIKADGVVYQIKDGVLVTILDPYMKRR